MRGKGGGERGAKSDKREVSEIPCEYPSALETNKRTVLYACKFQSA